MRELRRSRLAALLASPRFNGDRAKFCADAGITNGRLSQLLDPTEAFGDVAARNLCDALGLNKDYFSESGAASISLPSPTLSASGGPTPEPLEPPRPLATQDMSMALFVAYGSLVRVLHRSGSIDAGELADEIGKSLEHRRSRGIESAEQNKMLELIFQSVVQIEKHESDLASLKADFEMKTQALRDPPNTGRSK